MASRLEAVDVVAQSERAARSAARASGVRVRELGAMRDLVAAETLFDATWSADPTRHMLGSELLRALSFAGNYISGAFRGRELIGGAVGWFGGREGRHLHSDVAGVLPGAQSRGVGFALKLHQRAWTLERGMDEVQWTFDPLVRRNGHFNLVKLRARIVDYAPDFYGQMYDSINRGTPSDRAVISWRLDTPEVIAASERRAGASAMPGGPGDGHVVLEEGRGGVPRRRKAQAGVRLCWVPADIVGLRSEAPDVALSWRRALRAVLVEALHDGYEVTGLLPSGHYVLVKDAEQAPARRHRP